MIEYLNKSVWVTLGFSKIHNIGVIAIRDIPKGTLYTDYNLYNSSKPILPIVMNEDDFNKILPGIRNLILDKTVFIDSIMFFSPNYVQDIRSWMNHSDDPNTEGFIVTRDIKKGEELTENYRFFGDWHNLTKKHYES